MNPQGTKTYPEEGIGLPMPHEAIPSKGFSSLRFENSIRVEVKIEAPTGGTYAPGGPGSPSYMCNYAAAAIRKDPTFPGF
jgi:hypothetical protein